MRLLAAVLIGIAIYLLVTLLFSRRGIYRDTVRRRLDTVGDSQKKKFEANEDISKPIFERLFKPLFKSMAEKLAASNKKDTAAGKNRPPSKLKKMLAQAGFGLSEAEYSIIRLFIIILSTALFTTIPLIWVPRQKARFSEQRLGFLSVMSACVFS